MKFWIYLLVIVLILGYAVKKASDKRQQFASLPQETRNQIINKTNQEHVERFHDDEKNVTCWKFEHLNRGGLSCIPDNQLAKGKITDE